MKVKPKLTAMLGTILAGGLLSACGTTPLDLLPKQYQPAMYRDYEEDKPKNLAILPNTENKNSNSQYTYENPFVPLGNGKFFDKRTGLMVYLGE
jgi:hypothetical protein